MISRYVYHSFPYKSCVFVSNRKSAAGRKKCDTKEGSLRTVFRLCGLMSVDRATQATPYRHNWFPCTWICEQFSFRFAADEKNIFLFSCDSHLNHLHPCLQYLYSAVAIFHVTFDTHCPKYVEHYTTLSKRETKHQNRDMKHGSWHETSKS